MFRYKLSAYPLVRRTHRSDIKVVVKLTTQAILGQFLGFLLNTMKMKANTPGMSAKCQNEHSMYSLRENWNRT